MWRCKHCENEFDFTSRTEMGNHTRWCEKNPKRNSWNSAQAGINQYGSIRKYEVICENCENLFVVEEREKLFPQREKYYCSRSCANTVGGRKKAEIYHGDDVAVYSTVCFRHHEKKEGDIAQQQQQMQQQMQAQIQQMQQQFMLDRKSTRLNSSHITRSRMPSSA